MSHKITVAAGLTLAALLACQRIKPTDDLLREAQAAHARAEERAAVIHLKNLLQKEPGHAAARRLLGELHLAQGDPVSSEKELRRALSLGQSRRDVLPLLVRAMLGQRAYPAVLDELQGEPPTALVLAWRGHAQLGLGKAEDAALLYTQALHKDADTVEAHLGQARLALLRQDSDAAAIAVERAVVADPRNTESLRFKGELLRVRGDLAGAQRAYAAILALQPSNVQAHADLATIHLQAGKPELAHQQLAQARKLQPNSLAVYYTQAMLDYAEGKPKAALEHVQQILRAAPDHMPSLLLAATVELAAGSTSQARAHLVRYRQANPKEPYAIRLLASCALRENKPEETLALLEPLLSEGLQDVDTLALAGEAAMRSGKHELAARWFGQASALAPESGNLLAASGLSLLGQGEHGRAVEMLEQAVRKDGSASRAGALLVMTHLRQRRFEQAMEQIRNMEGQGDNPAVQNLKGGVLLASGDLAGAREAFARALELDPAHMPALDNLAELDLMEKKPTQARKRYKSALVQGKSGKVLVALARLEARLGDLAAAIGWLEKAAAEEPNAVAPAQMLAALYMRSGKQDKALQLAQRLQAATPGEAGSLDLLAQAEAANGRHQAALESLQKLASLKPTSADIQMRIARTQLTLQRKDAALAAARKAIAIEPAREEALALASSLMLDGRFFEDARKLARTVQQRQPNAGIGFKLEGDAWLEEGRFSEALAQYERGYALQRNGPMLIALHRALHSAGKGAAAEQRMLDWLAQHPNDQPTRLYFASHLLQRGDFAGARREYQSILQRDPDNVVALNDMAWAQLQLKDVAALETAERAHKLAPTNPAVADTLAWVLAETGDVQRALPLLKKALETAPTAADIRLHYAHALHRAGERRAARKQCEQLLALPAFARRGEVQQLLAQL